MATKKTTSPISDGEPALGSDAQRRYRLMREMLCVAVPLWVHRIEARGGVTGEDFARVSSDAYTDLIGSEHLLYHIDHKGHTTAEAFNKLAEAVAVLSYCPGGIHLFGEHWASPRPAATP